jgi:hypothetical protein
MGRFLPDFAPKFGNNPATFKKKALFYALFRLKIYFSRSWSAFRRETAEKAIYDKEKKILGNVGKRD